MEIKFFSNRTEKFFEETEPIDRPKVTRIFELLKLHGNNLGLPFSKSLGGGLFELRVMGRRHLRYIYVFYSDRTWILHGFVKKTDKISKKDLAYAKEQFVHLQSYNG